MNRDKLKRLERDFFTFYPGGFSDPALAGIGKKHKMLKMTDDCREAFKKIRFKDDEKLLESIASLTGKSSMVSLFEKPKYRDCLKAMSSNERAKYVDAFRKRLHGNQEKGFNEMLSLMADYKLAKWTLLTILPLYYRPQEEVFVKPTTAKNIISFLEIENITYSPRPSWQFYKGFKAHIDDMKSQVDESLSSNNAAFTGFLMMTINAAQSER